MRHAAREACATAERALARCDHVAAWRPLPAVIIAAAVMLAGAAGWNNSATADEPYHTLAAWAYVHDGHGDLNPEHPPLVKLLSGLMLKPLALRGPQHPPLERLDHLSVEVRSFLYSNTRDAQTILTVARLPGLLFLALLLAGTYAWGRLAWGRASGLLALVAIAGQPLVLGHAPIVHTDVAAAASWVWAGYLTHRWLAGATRGWVPLGAVLGAALAIKFSAVYLVLLVSLAVLWAAARLRQRRLLGGLCGAGVLSAVVLLAVVWPAVRSVTSADQVRVIGKHLALWRNTERAADFLSAISRLGVPAAQWGLGVAYVHFNNLTGQGVNYLCGRISVQGFPHYFPIALALKTSAPFLLAALWGAASSCRRRDRLGLALLGVVGFYLLISLGSNYNIGARHVLPILAALALPAAGTIATRSRLVHAVAVVSLASSAVFAFPHYISHFSLLAAGKGRECLSDSNVDWGQDWRRLCARARTEGWAPLGFVYLGAADPQSEGCAVDVMYAPASFRPAFLAVGAFVETIGPDYLQVFGETRDAAKLRRLLDWLPAHAEVVGEVGGSIKVYRLRQAPL